MTMTSDRKDGPGILWAGWFGYLVLWALLGGAIFHLPRVASMYASRSLEMPGFTFAAARICFFATDTRQWLAIPALILLGIGLAVGSGRAWGRTLGWILFAGSLSLAAGLATALYLPLLSA